MFGVFGSFRSYVMWSMTLMGVVIGHAFYLKRYFYRSTVYLSHSKFAVLAAANMALAIVLLLGRVFQTIFLGRLRLRERERLQYRVKDAVIEICFAVTVFREDFSLRFVTMFTVLLFLKIFHWLAKDRVELLEEQPLSPLSTHVRLLGLMAVLAIVDLQLVVLCLGHTYRSSGPTILVLFGFEFTVLIIELFSNFISYILNTIDLYHDGNWEGKLMMAFYNELLSDMCQLTVYVGFFLYVYFFYGLPIHILRDLYLTFMKLRKRSKAFLRYRRVLSTMDDMLEDATEEELQAGDRTCIICREEMRTAKKLPCGHLFCLRCLKGWLGRQETCPTCRTAVDMSATRVRGPRGNNGDNPQRSDVRVAAPEGRTQVHADVRVWLARLLEENVQNLRGGLQQSQEEAQGRGIVSGTPQLHHRSTHGRSSLTQARYNSLHAEVDALHGQCDLSHVQHGPLLAQRGTSLAQSGLSHTQHDSTQRRNQRRRSSPRRDSSHRRLHRLGQLHSNAGSARHRDLPPAPCAVQMADAPTVERYETPQAVFQRAEPPPCDFPPYDRSSTICADFESVKLHYEKMRRLVATLDRNINQVLEGAVDRTRIYHEIHRTTYELYETLYFEWYETWLRNELLQSSGSVARGSANAQQQRPDAQEPWRSSEQETGSSNLRLRSCFPDNVSYQGEDGNPRQATPGQRPREEVGDSSPTAADDDRGARSVDVGTRWRSSTPNAAPTLLDPVDQTPPSQRRLDASCHPTQCGCRGHMTARQEQSQHSDNTSSADGHIGGSAERDVPDAERTSQSTKHNGTPVNVANEEPADPEISKTESFVGEDKRLNIPDCEQRKQDVDATEQASENLINSISITPTEDGAAERRKAALKAIERRQREQKSVTSNGLSPSE